MAHEHLQSLLVMGDRRVRAAGFTAGLAAAEFPYCAERDGRVRAVGFTPSGGCCQMRGRFARLQQSRLLKRGQCFVQVLICRRRLRVQPLQSGIRISNKYHRDASHRRRAIFTLHTHFARRQVIDAL